MHDVTLTLTPVEADLVRDLVQKHRDDAQKRSVALKSSEGRRYAMHELGVCEAVIGKLPGAEGEERADDA